MRANGPFVKAMSRSYPPKNPGIAIKAPDFRLSSEKFFLISPLFEIHKGIRESREAERY